MKKALVGSLLVLGTALPIAPALAKKSDKVVIAFTPTGETEAQDCKISRKEIEKFQPEVANAGYICTQLDVLSTEKEELTPPTLAKLIAMGADESSGQVSVGFEGTNPEDLKATFAAWLDFLLSQPDTKDSAEHWGVSVEKTEATQATLKFDNAQSGESFIVIVTLGYEIPE